MLAAQVLVDRAGFSPGEIDGRGGSNTDKAIDAYERTSGSRLGDVVLTSQEPPTISYTITAEDAATPLVRSIPRDMVAKARLKRLGYTSVLEMLAERFHASPALLKRLNPRLQLGAGQQIVVPNVKVVTAAEGKPLPDIVVHVSKSVSTLWVTDGCGQDDPARPGDERQRARSAADRDVDRDGRRPQPDLQLQPRSVLGRRSRRRRRRRFRQARTTPSAWCGSTSASRTTASTARRNRRRSATPSRTVACD